MLARNPNRWYVSWVDPSLHTLSLQCLQETRTGGIHFEYTKVYLHRVFYVCKKSKQVVSTLSTQKSAYTESSMFARNPNRWYAIWAHESLHVLCLLYWQEAQTGTVVCNLSTSIYTKVLSKKSKQVVSNLGTLSLHTLSLLCLQEIQTGGTWYAIWVHKSLHTLSLLYLQETQVQI